MTFSPGRRTASLALIAACLPGLGRAQGVASLEIGILPNISARAAGPIPADAQFLTLRCYQWLAGKGLVRTRLFRTINTPTDDSVGNVVVQGDAIAAMLSGGE